MRCARPAISSLLLLAACGVQRPVDFGAVCPTYETDVRPLVAGRCGGCHSAANHEGGYVVGAYTDTASRSDDGTSRLPLFVKAVNGELEGHQAVPEADAAKLADWAVRCKAAPRALRLHPQGWSTPTDPGFHGAALRAAFYDFNQCKQCHGDDLRGGKAQVDCQSCHPGPEGPLGCGTCHGDATSAAPPRDLKGARTRTSIGVGAHRAHVTQAAIPCTACHREVKKATDDGHYRSGGVFSAGPAEVQLKSGVWNRGKATCEGTTCHSPFPADTAPTRKDPVWTTTAPLGCGACHGEPPSSHAAGITACEGCHPAASAPTHANGKVELRPGADTCSGCHSGPGATKFVGLDGKPHGAHDAHLGASKLRGPLACGDCHLVPATLNAPGHLDAPPADVTVGFDRPSGTCTASCHASNVGAPDTTPGLIRAPAWDGGSDQATCGACHGLPPIDGSPGHAPNLNLPCATCHGGSILPDGGIRFVPLPDGGMTSQHIDGKVTGS